MTDVAFNTAAKEQIFSKLVDTKNKIESIEGRLMIPKATITVGHLMEIHDTLNNL